MDPLLSFSHDSVKIEGSTAYGKERSFSLECSIDDIVNISCQWFNKVSDEILLLKCTFQSYIILVNTQQHGDFQILSG